MVVCGVSRSSGSRVVTLKLTMLIGKSEKQIRLLRPKHPTEERKRKTEVEVDGVPWIDFNEDRSNLD